MGRARPHLQGVRRPWRRPRRARRRRRPADRRRVRSLRRRSRDHVGPRLPALLARPGRGDRRRRHLAGGRRHRPGARLDRPAVLRVRLARRAGRDAHGEPQPAAVQRPEVLPAGRAPRRRGHRAATEIRELAEGRRAAAGPGPGDVEPARPARALRRARPLVRRRGRDAAADRGDRYRQRDGWPRRAGRVGAAPGQGASPVPRARRHVPEPSGRPDRPGEPARPEGRGAGARAPTWGWPSTATPIACSWWTSGPRT